MTCILSITSHVVHGYVGGRVSGFVFERLGLGLLALPSVLYPATPGPGRPRGASVPQEIFAHLIASISEETLGGVAALHIGYLRSPEQVKAVQGLIARVRRAAPEALILLDPILGDAPGGLYVPEDTARAIKAQLLGRVDIATPNLFELGFLAGRSISTQAEAIAAARNLKIGTVVVTSAPAPGGEASTLLVERARALRLCTENFPSAPHGNGDLLASILLARLVHGEAMPAALAKAVASVHDLIRAARAGGLDHLPIVAHQTLLAEPATTLVPVAADSPAG